MFGFGGMFNNLPHSFNTQYRCYSVAMLAGNERDDVEKGGKIILPPSALDVLTRLNIVYPMLFKLTNTRQKRVTHCGVLEFVADEGKAYIPHWMMRNLYLSEGDFVHIESATLPVASFAKFQPQTVDFLDITDPKAVLENLLRGFACLTKGDMLAIKYNKKIYELLVLKTQPSDAVSIIECDMQVDFAEPVGYVAPQRQTKKETKVEPEPSLDNIPEEYINRGPQLFPGKGTRLDGKKKKSRDSVDGVNVKPTILKKGIPDMKFEVGTLTFIRRILKPAQEKDISMSEDFKAFQGEGEALREKK